MHNVYVTFGFRAREDWDTFMPPAKIDGRWKEETKAAKLPELNAKRLADSPLHLSAGTVECIVAMYKGKVETFKAPEEFFDWIAGDRMPFDIAIVGIETLHALRHCGWDCARKKIRTPAWLWNSGVDTNKTVINLLTISGAKPEGFKLREWLLAWGANWPDNLVEQVKLIAELATLMGI